MVYSEGARGFFFFFLTGVEEVLDGRTLAGLAVFVLVGSWVGDLARTVLGCDPVLDVISVLS